MNAENTTPESTSQRPHVSRFFCNASPWLIIIAGIAQILIGIFMMSVPIVSSLALTWVVGIMMLVLAGFMVAQLFTSPSKRGLLWGILSVILLLIAGYYSITQTLSALFAWTIILGAYLLFMGVSRIILSLSLRGHTGFGWMLFNGILSLVLGGIILFMPNTPIWLIGFIIGIEIIFSGWTLLLMGIVTRRLKKNSDTCPE